MRDLFDFEFSRDIVIGFAIAVGGVCIMSALFKIPIEATIPILLRDYGTIIGSVLATTAALLTVDRIRAQMSLQREHFDKEQKRQKQVTLEASSAESYHATLSLLRASHVLTARHSFIQAFIKDGVGVTAEVHNSFPKPAPISDTHYGALKKMRGSGGVTSLIHLDLISQSILPPGNDVDLKMLNEISRQTATALIVTSQMYAVSWLVTYQSDKEQSGEKGEERYEGQEYVKFMKKIMSEEGDLNLEKLRTCATEAGRNPPWEGSKVT